MGEGRLPGAGRGLYRKDQLAGRAEKAEASCAGGDGPPARGMFVRAPTRGNPAAPGDCGPAWPGGAGTLGPGSERTSFPPRSRFLSPVFCKADLVIMRNSSGIDRENVSWERIFNKSFRKRPFIKRASLGERMLRRKYKIAPKHHKGSI